MFIKLKRGDIGLKLRAIIQFAKSNKEVRT
jgi:hypothetical protein